MERIRENLVQIVLGLALGLVFLGHAARVYQIPLVSVLDAFIYDARLRLTMPGGSTTVSSARHRRRRAWRGGRWPWSRDKMATLLDRPSITTASPFSVSTSSSPSRRQLRPPVARCAVAARTEGRYQLPVRPQGLRDARLRSPLRRGDEGEPAGRPRLLLHQSLQRARQRALPEPVLPPGTFKAAIWR